MRKIMNPYEFRASLRIVHPTIDPDRITKVLGYEPSRVWKVGEPRTTPTGIELDGHYTDSYWCTELDNGISILSEDVTLESFLSDSSASLYKYSEFFKELNESGGRIEYFISVFDSSNIGFQIDSDLLASLCDIGVELGMDISTTERVGT